MPITLHLNKDFFGEEPFNEESIREKIKKILQQASEPQSGVTINITHYPDKHRI